MNLFNFVCYVYNLYKCATIMSIRTLEFCSSYFVAKTLCTHLKFVDAVQPYRNFFRYNILCFVPGSFNTHVDETSGVKVNSDLVKLKSSDTNKKLCQRQPARDVLEYMHSKESLKSTLSYLPNRILKRKKGLSQEAIYTVDTEVARDIANEVIDNMEQRNVPVFEINPGIGILSKELLLAGISGLYLCEPSSAFTKQMQILLTDFPTQAQLINQDLLSLSKLTYQDKQDGGLRVQQLFAKVSKGDWTDDPVMVIIGTLPSLTFIRHLIHCHIHQKGILSYGRPELYVMMSPSNYFYLTCDRHDGYLYYRSVSVLFQLIFQWNVLKKLPRKAFLPWDVKYSPKKWSKLTKIRNIDPEFLYLVRIVPHRDFFERIVKAEQLHQFWYFIWYHMVSRKNRVIPQLEKWIPGCGPRLIVRDMTVHTEFGDLTPHQIVSLFHEFTSWPEYPDSPFLSSMETMLMLMEQSGEEGLKSTIGDEDNIEDEAIVEYQETER